MSDAINRNLNGGRVMTRGGLSKLVEQFPDLRRGEVVSRAVTVPAGAVIEVPLAPSSRGVRVLTALTDLRMACGEDPEPLAGGGTDLFREVTVAGCVDDNYNGIYVWNRDGRYYLDDNPSGEVFIQNNGADRWRLYFDYGTGLDIQFQQDVYPSAAGPTGGFSNDGDLVDPDGITVTPGAARVCQAPAAVGTAIAAGVWEVRLIEDEGFVSLYSATGGAVTVEAF